MSDTSTVVDHIGFRRMIDRALLGVVREALAGVSRTGLIGDHHFEIRFLVAAPGTTVPEAAKSRLGAEAEITLDGQYRDLAVDEEAFEVTLPFGGLAEARLRVPFAALTRFADPSVGLGLDFATAREADPPPTPRPTPPPSADGAERPNSATVVPLDAFRRR